MTQPDRTAFEKRLTASKLSDQEACKEAYPITDDARTYLNAAVLALARNHKSAAVSLLTFAQEHINSALRALKLKKRT